MAGAHYDGIAGIFRVTESGGKPDPFAVEVLAYHGAIESEIERIISGLVERPDELFTAPPRLTFGHKVNVLRAVWNGEPGQADKICPVLLRLNDLRNAVAHTDPKEIKGCLAGLINAYRKIDNSIGDEVSLLEVMQGICLFFQDGPNVTEINAMAEALDELVNVTLPKAFGAQE